MKVIEGGVTAPAGFSASAGRGGLRKSGKNDIALIYSGKVCNTAAVFTSNRLKAAPVLVTASIISAGKRRINGAVINSGNANALTGVRGIRDAKQMGAYAAKLLGVPAGKMTVFSTGVIGQFLPMKKVYAGIKDAVSSLSDSLSAGTKAAEAIMTTDKTRKEIAVEQTLSDGRRIRIGGMTKGSGMIAPDMKGLHATTLTFVTTDAPVSSRYLQKCLDSYIEDTLNMVCIDGDQSTNDSVLVLSNGSAGGPSIRNDPMFEEAFGYVMHQLARMLAMDGEGETKLLTVEVNGARNVQQARLAARAVVKSNLVKCAVFGGDPNVGRIAAALGSSGCDIDFSKLDVSIGEDRKYPVISSGIVSDKPGRAANLMRKREVKFTIELHKGKGSAVALGCDMSYGYVRINSAYTT